MYRERMSMHLDILIFRTDRHSDGLSTIPDDLNTLTLQSAGMNNTPRDPLHRPVTGNMTPLI